MGKKNLKSVTLYLTEAEKQKLETKAKLSNLTLSNYLRKLNKLNTFERGRKSKLWRTKNNPLKDAGKETKVEEVNFGEQLSLLADDSAK